LFFFLKKVIIDIKGCVWAGIFVPSGWAVFGKLLDFCSDFYEASTNDVSPILSAGYSAEKPMKMIIFKIRLVVMIIIITFVVSFRATAWNPRAKPEVLYYYSPPSASASDSTPSALNDKKRPYDLYRKVIV